MKNSNQKEQKEENESKLALQTSLFGVPSGFCPAQPPSVLNSPSLSGTMEGEEDSTGSTSAELEEEAEEEEAAAVEAAEAEEDDEADAATVAAEPAVAAAAVGCALC